MREERGPGDGDGDGEALKRLKRGGKRWKLSRERVGEVEKEVGEEVSDDTLGGSIVRLYSITISNL